MVNQPQPPYSLNDVLLLLGQCTVELAYLRARIVELELRLPEEERTSANGSVAQEVPGTARHGMHVQGAPP